MFTSAACVKKWRSTPTIPPSSKLCAALVTCSKAKANPKNRSESLLRVSLFWRPVLICLALVAAILFAVQWDSPKTLPKIWAALIIFLVAAGFAFFLSSRSVTSRIRRLKDFTERAAAGDFTPLERDHGHDELADLADALGRTAAGLGQTIRTLTDERNRSSAILGSMVEGVAVVTGDERILFCN